MSSVGENEFGGERVVHGRGGPCKEFNFTLSEMRENGRF